MPLPLLLLAGAVGTAVSTLMLKGNTKYEKEFNDIKKRNDNNISKYKNQENLTTSTLNELNKKKSQLDKDFKKFQEIFEKIKNRPNFAEILKEKGLIHNFTAEELKETSEFLNLFLNTTGTTLGVVGASSAFSTFGGGLTFNVISNMVGTTLISGATLGVGILVGAIYSNIQKKSLSNKVDEAYSQMLKNEENINKVCFYLKELNEYLTKFLNSMNKINDKFTEHLRGLIYMDAIGKTNYNEYNSVEKKYLENTLLLIGLLYKMCKIKLITQVDTNQVDANKINISSAVLGANLASGIPDNVKNITHSDTKYDINKINKDGINKIIFDNDEELKKIEF